MAFSPADCERLLQLLWDCRNRATQDSTTRGTRAPPARSTRVRRDCQFRSALAGNCSHFCPLSADLDTLPPERHFTLFKQVLKRLGTQNRREGSYPRHPRTSTTRTVVQRLQERAYFLRTTCVPADTEARLDSQVELAPVLLASAPLPPPTPTPACLQWDWY